MFVIRHGSDWCGVREFAVCAVAIVQPLIPVDKVKVSSASVPPSGFHLPAKMYAHAGVYEFKGCHRRPVAWCHLRINSVRGETCEANFCNMSSSSRPGLTGV